MGSEASLNEAATWEWFVTEYLRLGGWLGKISDRSIGCGNYAERRKESKGPVYCAVAHRVLSMDIDEQSGVQYKL